jgi:hypothetical protein
MPDPEIHGVPPENVSAQLRGGQPGPEPAIRESGSCWLSADAFRLSGGER